MKFKLIYILATLAVSMVLSSIPDDDVQEMVALQKKKIELLQNLRKKLSKSNKNVLLQLIEDNRGWRPP